MGRRSTIDRQAAKTRDGRTRKAKPNHALTAARRSNLSNAEMREQVRVLACELAEAREQQTATANVLKAISSSAFDLQTVLNALTESAARLCEADMGAITRQGSDGGFYHATNYNFPPDWVEFASKWAIQPGRGSVGGRVLVQRVPVQVADVFADLDYEFLEPAKKAGYRTLLGVPLLREENPIGVITLGRKAVRPFTDKQIEVVTTFANQAAIAIENTRLLNELRESLQQQTATSEVLRIISSSPVELAPVFDAMLANATRICEANFGNLYLRDGEVFRLAAAHNTPPALVEERRRTPLGVDDALRRMVQTKEVVNIADLSAEPSYAAQHPQTVTAVKLGAIRTVLFVPMVKENELSSSGALPAKL